MRPPASHQEEGTRGTGSAAGRRTRLPRPKGSTPPVRQTEPIAARTRVAPRIASAGREQRHPQRRCRSSGRAASEHHHVKHRADRQQRDQQVKPSYVCGRDVRLGSRIERTPTNSPRTASHKVRPGIPLKYYPPRIAAAAELIKTGPLPIRQLPKEASSPDARADVKPGRRIQALVGTAPRQSRDWCHPGVRRQLPGSARSPARPAYGEQQVPRSLLRASSGWLWPALRAGAGTRSLLAVPERRRSRVLSIRRRSSTTVTKSGVLLPRGDPLTHQFGSTIASCFHPSEPGTHVDFIG